MCVPDFAALKSRAGIRGAFFDVSQFNESVFLSSSMKDRALIFLMAEEFTSLHPEVPGVPTGSRHSAPSC